MLDGWFLEMGKEMGRWDEINRQTKEIDRKNGLV